MAEAIQPHASQYNAKGELQVLAEPSPDLSTAVNLRHVVNKKEVFRISVRLKDFVEVQSGTLPTTEGVGFTLTTTAGGTGYQEKCTYGFRFVNDTVEYRTLSAAAEDRQRHAVSLGQSTGWTRLTLGSQ